MTNFAYGISLTEGELAEQEEICNEYAQTAEECYSTATIGQYDRVARDTKIVVEFLQYQIDAAELEIDAVHKNIIVMNSVRSLPMTPLQSFDFAVDMQKLNKTLRKWLCLAETHLRLQNLVNDRFMEFWKMTLVANRLEDANRLEEGI